MKNNDIFENLFVLDIANNHFGSLSHAKKIIDQYGKIVKKLKIKAVFKFQFRNLETFVHKDFINSEEKYVRRFLDTKLSDKNFEILVKKIKKKNILTSCTPFDEQSVDKIEKLKFDIIKIASVSALDFNLHERVIKNKIPKIISTGGIKIEDVDKIVSFYKKMKQQFAIMHCVSLYPSENDKLQLSLIKDLNERYRDVPIGWSTHEDPKDFRPSILALASGAKIFEKHIGISSKKFKLNNYSITPKVFSEWYLNILENKKILGNGNDKIITKKEIETINSLQRGIYAKKDLRRNEKLILNKNVYFAFPIKKGQLISTQLKGNIVSKISIKKDQPLKNDKVIFDKKLINDYKIGSYVHKAKALLNYAKISMSEIFDMEISHHSGIKNFEKVGCYLFNIVNKEYAKKLIVMLPNQKHPLHFHKKKSESFIILHGALKLVDNKIKYSLKPGDIVHLKKSSWHKFTAGNKGCIFEEISSTSLSDDSFYYRKKIKKMKRDKRKTYINNWYSLGKDKIVQEL
tara:strand:+ start:5931 stop:7478 length:1548 start_codon:yes stop_codon:yes gene_type:complete